MYKIRLNDGTEYHARYCSEGNGEFITRIETDASFVDVTLKFASAENTKTMLFLYDSTEQAYEGYTELESVTVATNGDYIIMLGKA